LESGEIPCLKIRPRKIKFDCSQCPGWCCSYERIRTTPDDIALLAEHFDCDEIRSRRTALDFIDGEWFLRHRKDDIYKSICVFFDRDKRHCGIYDVRPVVCHKFPWQNLRLLRLPQVRARNDGR
jgi:Fe-S-cluster containining protein